MILKFPNTPKHILFRTVCEEHEKGWCMDLLSNVLSLACRCVVVRSHKKCCSLGRRTAAHLGEIFMTQAAETKYSYIKICIYDAKHVWHNILQTCFSMCLECEVYKHDENIYKLNMFGIEF